MCIVVCGTEGGNVKDQPNWFPKVHRMPSEWVMPDTFPDLSKYDEIAIDLETRDPSIKDNYCSRHTTQHG